MPSRTVLCGLIAIATVGSPASAGADVFVLAPGVSALIEPPNADAEDDRAGFGPTLSLALLELPSTHEPGRMLAGVQGAFSSAGGPGDRALYDFGIELVATVAFTEAVLNPFISLGPAVLVYSHGPESGGVALGVRGELGMHGILFERLYWRLQGGFVGPAVGGLRAEAAVGYALH